MTLWDEDPREEEAIFMFHPVHTFINKTVRDFTARPVLQDIFIEEKSLRITCTKRNQRIYENLDLRDLNPLSNHKMAIMERMKSVAELHTEA